VRCSKQTGRKTAGFCRRFLSNTVNLRGFTPPGGSASGSISAATGTMGRLLFALIENQLVALDCGSLEYWLARRREPVGDPIETFTLTIEASSRPPQKDKNHRQGIAGGFGGLS